MSLLALSGTNSVSGGYDIDNSLKFEPDNTEYLVKTPSSNGNRRTFTISLWIKRTELGSHMTLFGAQPSSGWTNGNTFQFGFTNDDKFQCGLQTIYVVQTNRVFRDTSAWTHVVVAVDTTQSTVANRFKLYINGVQETSWLVDQIYGISQNQELGINHTTRHQIGRLIQNSWGFAGYIAEMHNVDGQQLAPTSFGEFDDDSGIWKPKAYTGTYGTNGFYLDFADASDLGDDESGNGNDYTENNITSADQAVDSPTNNFCTPLLIQPFNSTDTITHTEGGTKLTTGGGTGWRTNMASVSLSSGKWYFEAKHPGTIDGDAIMTSIVPTARFGSSSYASFYGGQSSGDGIGWYWDSTRFRYDDGSAISPPTNTVNSGDILGIALDMDNNFVYSRINGGAWHNNGSADGDPTSGSSGTGGFAVADEPHMICTSMYQPSRNFFVNFGGYNAFPVSSSASDANGYGNFEYAPPSGYYALCTKNLAEYG